jgi:hypothetical protein
VTSAQCKLGHGNASLRSMIRRAFILALTALLPAVAGAQGAPSNGPTARASDSEYLRIEPDETGAPASLQTPIIAFEPADGEPRGLRVDLIGAIHIADAAYYRALNERFGDYDSVLYELVAPEGARPDPNSDSDNIVSGAQVGMTRLLGLTFQLNGIDYTRPNMVHADLTPEALAQSMSDRGESILGYLSKLLAAAMSEEALQKASAADGPGLFEILFSPDREHLLKVELANSMLDVEGFNRIIEGDTGSALISERNEHALSVLAERIRRGDRHIAIFYGVAHLPDMARRLESEVGLTRRDVTWVDAWDLRPSGSK